MWRSEFFTDPVSLKRSDIEWEYYTIRNVSGRNNGGDDRGNNIVIKYKHRAVDTAIITE